MKMFTCINPGVTVDLVERHRVTVVLLLAPPAHYDHGVFNERCGVEEAEQWLYRGGSRGHMINSFLSSGNTIYCNGFHRLAQIISDHPTLT